MFKFLGAILLIIGTSIGGGMLALPVATASLGFLPAAGFLLITWLVMTLGALLILEVNAWLPPNSNLISMAGATIGRLGQVFAWITYLLLLYSLLSAYIAGGQEVIHTLFSYAGIHLSMTLSIFIFLILFAGIVYCGIRSVDITNRLIMAIKLVSYLSLVATTSSLIHGAQLIESPKHLSMTLGTLMIMITSYGFAIIVPSLRSYFQNDIKSLRRAVLIGSFVPLIFYLMWEAIIFSVLPKTGTYSLQTLADSHAPVATLMTALSHLSQHSWLIAIANVFTSVCVITAFLGVALCLIDFFADGLKLAKRGKSGALIFILTFVPPLLLVLFAQKVFILGLSFAGICCIFLLILLPAWMTWAGRYQREFTSAYPVFGGKILLALVMLAAIGLLIAECLQFF